MAMSKADKLGKFLEKAAVDRKKDKKLDVNDMITHKLPMNETPKGFKLVADAKDSMKVIIEPQK